MQILDYLNTIYDSNDVSDYQYEKIDPETEGLSDLDKDILTLILDILRLNENYSQRENVFSQFNSKRLPELKSITKDELSPILSLNVGALPLPIRARVADFLWETIKEPKSAGIAIQAYLDLYEVLWDEDHWPDCIDAIKRAVNIACSFNKKGKEYEKCISTVIEGLNRTRGNDRLFLSASLLVIMAEQKCKINADIKQYARNAIETAKRDSNLRKAQIILETLAKLDPQNKNVYFEEAGDITQALALGPAVRRVHTLKEALQYFDQAGSEEKKQLCRKQMEEAQSHVLEEMHKIESNPIDISSTVNEVEDMIKETDNFKQALIVFGDLVEIYSREELLDHIKKASVFTNLFPSTRVDQKGRQMYSLSPLPLGKKLGLEDEIVQQHMWDKARELQEVNADIILKYAVSELNRIYQYDENDLKFLFNNNAIIPDGREDIIRKGLFLGLQNDLYAALHILLPQM